MNWADLKLFHTVVETGGFSAAARSLELPTSNVSRRIILLEEHLKFSLFLRTTRVVTPTEEGLFFYQRTKSMSADFEHTLDEINNKQKSIKGSIRVQLLPAAAPLIPFFHSFQSKYPEINLDLVIESQNINLIEHHIDLAIKVGEQSDSNLKCRKLPAITMKLVASPKYIEDKGNLDSLDDLKDRNCLLFRDSANRIKSTWELTKDKITSNIDVTGNFLSNDISLIKQAAILGQGIALLPRIICKEDIKNNRLIALLDCYQKYDVWLVFPANKYQSACLRLLIDFLLEASSDDIANLSS